MVYMKSPILKFLLLHSARTSSGHNPRQDMFEANEYFREQLFKDMKIQFRAKQQRCIDGEINRIKNIRIRIKMARQ